MEPVKKTATPVFDNLNNNIEEIIQLLADGKSYRFIANKFNCSIGYFTEFVNTSEHSARAKAALTSSAEYHFGMAGEVLDLEGENLTKEGIMLAKEKSQYHKWAAAVRDRKKMGDKVELSGDADNPLQVNVVSGMKIV